MKFPDDLKYQAKLFYQANKEEKLEYQRKYNSKHYVNKYVKVGFKPRSAAEPLVFKKSGFKMIITPDTVILTKGISCVQKV